jgi:spore coat protein U-like protein
VAPSGGLLACGLAGAAFSLSALAGGSNSLVVGASVTGQCKVTTNPAVLDFGTIDPSGTSNALASVTFGMKCTKGTVSQAAVDNGGLYFSAGTRRMRHSVSPGAFLPYTLTYTGDSGFVGEGFCAQNTERTVTVSGTITPVEYQNALSTGSAEVYSDTVVITVAP